MTSTKQVTTGKTTTQTSDANHQVVLEEQSPLSWLFSSESEEENEVRRVRVPDEGSCSQLARVDVQGVPADGIIDSGADITIIGGKLFRHVAAVARLRKSHLKGADKVPRTYDRKTFSLDGRMDLDISFGDKTMRTPEYIKMDAHDQLLLSEGVCRQLGIVSYHPDVRAAKTRKSLPFCTKQRGRKQDAFVPTVRVHLLQSGRLSPHQSACV